MKNILLTIVILLLSLKYGYAQFINKYGLNIGAIYSNQLWAYKIGSIDNSNKDYKLGLSAFLSTEKKLSNFFSIRSEVGYIQKGFKNNVELYFTDMTRTSAGVDKKNVLFHDLCLNIGLKLLYQKINEYSGYDLKSWIKSNVDWTNDFNAETIVHFEECKLLQYLLW